MVIIPFELKVNSINCEAEIYIPNAFSPNGDGQNDDFRVFIKETSTLNQFQLSIFDRWGNQVFFSSDPSTSWDGSFQSQLLQEGIYLWSISYVSNNVDSNGEIILKGNVLLMR